MSGWRILAVDRLFGEDHDLSILANQVTIRKQFRHADFVWAALDCSDKSRIREIPVKHARENSLPAPLRSEEFPMGLPDLQGHDRERVTASNDTAEFVLGELRLLQTRGGASGRDNPSNSIHWYTPTEVQMMAKGSWWDKFYDGCTLQGVRRKKQRIRHDVEEIDLWPDMRCRHLHHPQEWTPQQGDDGSTWYPKKKRSTRLVWYSTLSTPSQHGHADWEKQNWPSPGDPQWNAQGIGEIGWRLTPELSEIGQ